MYFITAQDPNYTVKGSRDPLGFQVIWQGAGRELIPYLSTVSANIKDFQILCIAFALKKELDIQDADFELFFIRFEQLMAYTRFRQNPDEGFNGIDKVRKIMATSPATVKISNTITDQILSNQRAYGIWGKYIRPFTDMGITKTPEFEKIFIEKIKANSGFMHQVALLKKKTEGAAQVYINKLDAYFDLLNRPTGEERELFISHILEDNCDKELLRLLSVKKNPGNGEFYDILTGLSDASTNTKFKAVLAHILNTEKVLSPLNHIFRYLQTRSFWKIEEISNDKYIRQWRTSPEIAGFSELTKSLSALLALPNIDLVNGLVKRNEEVSAKRKSAPWVRLTGTGFEINHFEGAYFWEDYDPERHDSPRDNTYFLSSYNTLFRQLN